jgi:hypothetical protein
MVQIILKKQQKDILALLEEVSQKKTKNQSSLRENSGWFINFLQLLFAYYFFQRDNEKME